MKKIQIREDGFSAVELLLVLVAVGLVGFLGWWVYQARDDNKTTTATTTQTTTTQTTSPPLSRDETDGWTLYTAKASGYTLRIPDGWKLLYDPDSEILVSDKQDNTADITYAKGTKATLTPTTIGDDALHRFTVGTGVPDSVLASYTQAGTVQGVNATATKYTYTQTTEPEGPGLPKGAKAYRYHFVKDNKVIDVSYVITTSDPDNTAVVEKSVATFTFL